MSRAWLTQLWTQRYKVISQLQPHEACHWQFRCLFSEAQERKLEQQFSPGGKRALPATPLLRDLGQSRSLLCVSSFQQLKGLDGFTLKFYLVLKLPSSGKGMDWEFGVGRCKLLHLAWINNKVLMYSTGNYVQYPVLNHSGKEYKKRMYICV